MIFETFDINVYLRRYSNRKIVLYGHPDMAYITSLFLNERGIKDYVLATYEGKHVISFNDCISRKELFDIYDENHYVILWSEMYYSNSETKCFAENGIDKVFSVRKLWEDYADYDLSEYGPLYHNLYEQRKDYFFFEDAIMNPESVYLFSLDAVVTERCSLKCKDCSNLMQYYCNPQNLDVDEINNNLMVLLSKVDRIHDLRILGGEPFMNMEFVKIIKKFHDNDKIDQISIYTNSTIFPGKQNEKVLDYLKYNKVVMRFSDYGVLSRKLNEWIDWCREEKVSYQVIKMETWQDLGRLERRNYSNDELIDVYGSCECRNTPTLIHDKLFNCPYSANAYNLDAMLPIEADKDYLLIGNNTGRENIDSFLYDRKCLEACRYCSGRNVAKAHVKPYAQIKHSLAYLKYSQYVDNDKEFLGIIPQEDAEEKLVSIVVPFCNEADTIDRCISSILRQTYSRIELILVDDGSVDDSVSICNKYIDRYPEKIKMISCEHKGVLLARKQGIINAEGYYLMFVDADDWISEDWVATLVSGVLDADLCMSRWWIVDAEKRIPDYYFDRGQSGKRLYEDYPKAGVYRDDNFKSLIINNISLKHNLVFRHLWNKIFITSKMQEVCNSIIGNVSCGEDYILNVGYVIKCSSINVLNRAGYYYSEAIKSVHNEKYTLSKFTVDIDVANKILEKFREGKNSFVNEVICSVLQDFISLILYGMNNEYGDVEFYYPYFGRFDSKRIVLYGAGNVGRSFYKSLIKEETVELVAWIDKNAVAIREKSYLPVNEVSVIENQEYDAIIVAVYAKPSYEKIRSQLMRIGVHEDKIVWNKTKALDVF